MSRTMSQSRKNSLSPYSSSHYSSTNFNESSNKVNTPSQSKKSQPQWNDYLTDPNQFKISKSELIRRKKSFVSKHNILANDNVPKVSSINSSFSPRTNKFVASPIKRATHVISTPSPNTTTRVPYSIKSKQTPSKNAEEFNSIDLLYNQDESNLHTTLDLYEFDSNGEDNESGEEEENISNDNNDEDISNDDNKEDMEATFTVDLKNYSNEDIDKTTLYGMNSSKIRNLTKTQNIKNNEKRMMRNNINKPSNNNKNNTVIKVKKNSTSIDSFDLEDMMSQIKGLGTELRYYEQLSGRRSVFDATELDSIITDNEITNVVPVMKYLTQLVCQSMTYLLQSEIKLQKQQTDYDVISDKVDKLTSIVVSNNMYHNKINQMSTPTPFPVSSKNSFANDISSVMSTPFSPTPSKNNSTIAQKSQMTGSSPTDWLFSNSIQSNHFSTPFSNIKHSDDRNFQLSTSKNDSSRSLIKSALNYSEDTDHRNDNIDYNSSIITNLNDKFGTVLSQSPARDIHYNSRLNTSSDIDSNKIHSFLKQEGLLSIDSSPMRHKHLQQHDDNVDDEEQEQPTIIIPQSLPHNPTSAPTHPFINSNNKIVHEKVLICKPVYDATCGSY